MNSGRKGNVTTYYPPRARWYTRIFCVTGERVLRQLRLDKLSLPGSVSLLQFVFCLALPGFSFFALRRRTVGLIFVAAYLLSALVFLVAMGYRAGSLAFGMLISIHATSIAFLEGLWLGKERFGLRLLAAFCTLISVWGLVYSPALQFVENHWLMPLRQGKHVFVVKRTGANSIHRGDWVAYSISRERASQAGEFRVFVGEGFGIQPVLGVPGDRVRFESNKLLINEQSITALPRMPQNGEFVVNEKVWFIWPALDIEIRGAVAKPSISAAFQKLALVPEEEIVGKAFKSWFGRRQSL
jgi:hypothetical protein